MSDTITPSAAGAQPVDPSMAQLLEALPDLTITADTLPIMRTLLSQSLVPTPDGVRERATDRFVGFWETRDAASTVDYPFALIDIRLDKNKRGTGKMSAAAKVDIDRATRELLLENYASEPVRLTDVKVK